jgi:hypothetical protein
VWISNQLKLQIFQMNLLRRGRYCAPIAERKRKSAGLSNHLGYKIHPVAPLCNLRRLDARRHSRT